MLSRRLLSHLPLITHQAHANAAPRGVVVRFAVNTHADIGIDVSHQIITVFHETFDDGGAIDLMDLVMDLGRSRRPVGAQTIGIAFGVIRYDQGDIASIMVDADASGQFMCSPQGLTLFKRRVVDVGRAEENVLEQPGQGVSRGKGVAPLKGVLQ